MPKPLYARPGAVHAPRPWGFFHEGIGDAGSRLRGRPSLYQEECREEEAGCRMSVQGHNGGKRSIGILCMYYGTLRHICQESGRMMLAHIVISTER